MHVYAVFEGSRYHAPGLRGLFMRQEDAEKLARSLPPIMGGFNRIRDEENDRVVLYLQDGTDYISVDKLEVIE